MSAAKKIVLVLGAHRSGTSLCTAAIEGLGAQLCIESEYANEENHKGFFEHPDIVQFNDRLLLHLGGVWDNPLFHYGAGAGMQVWRDEAVALLRNTFGEVATVAIKDPRLCQLLDFWVEVLALAGYGRQDIFCVHTLRDPVEVALSQQHRSRRNPGFYEIGRTLEEAACLWLSLTAQALASSRELNTWYISYQSLLDDTDAALLHLANFLGLEVDEQRVREFGTDFVDPALHRSFSTTEASANLATSTPQVLEFYAAVQPLLENRGSSAEYLNQALGIFSRPDTQDRIISVSSAALSRLSNSCRSERLQLERSAEEVDNLLRQKDELEQTNQAIHQEHEAVVAPLRTELQHQQAGISDLQGQLKVQQDQLAAQQTRLREQRDQLVAQGEEVASLQRDCAYLVDQREQLQAVLEDMRGSTSWRLTAPLRAARRAQRASRNWLSRCWGRFRLRAILIYHKMSLRYPGTAWTVRRALRPIFRSLNGLFREQVIAPPVAGSGETPQGMKYQHIEMGEAFAPLISVIVPNYNHASYLRLRLDSIFSQTYQNIEVILLDDASSDNSAAILQEYRDLHPGNTILHINEKNSGSVFNQWERGLGLAGGDIVWIAESDDWCTENFLETLVPFFQNEAIQLAYARTVFMDKEGDRQTWSINEYLHELDPQRWNHPIVETGANIVADSFAIMNIIPNVSSALFRTPRSLELLQDPQWREMSTCGDWVLYLHLLRGGMLAYSPDACNYYRMHGENTSVGAYSQDKFYREHEQVALTARQYFDVPESAFEKLRDNLIIHWRETRSDFSAQAFEACFNLDRIRESGVERAPNLLMASYAFCSGGGETFPVSLANIMKGKGYNVTYLDCAQEPRNEGVRQRLRSDIPIVSDFRQLENIIADFDIDVIHSHHAWMDSTILDLLPEDGPCKTVVTLHGMYETINDYDLRVILPRLVRRSGCLIYVAEKNLDALRKHNLLDEAMVVRIDNALEETTLEPVSRQSLGIDGDAFVLALVSRGLKEKGWAEAIDCVSRARKESGCDIQLMLVGDGAEYERLRMEELPPFIHLAGFQRNVQGHFAAADLGFLPSRFRGESFPLVIIECLQAGRPCLASELGDIPYMLETPEGLAGELVALKGEAIDIQAVTAAIVNLASDPDYFKSLCKRVPLAAAKFDPAVLARKHDEVYRKAVQNTASAKSPGRD